MAGIGETGGATDPGALSPWLRLLRVRLLYPLLLALALGLVGYRVVQVQCLTTYQFLQTSQLGHSSRVTATTNQAVNTARRGS